MLHKAFGIGNLFPNSDKVNLLSTFIFILLSLSTMRYISAEYLNATFSQDLVDIVKRYALRGKTKEMLVECHDHIYALLRLEKDHLYTLERIIANKDKQGSPR